MMGKTNGTLAKLYEPLEIFEMKSVNLRINTMMEMSKLFSYTKIQKKI